MHRRTLLRGSLALALGLPAMTAAESEPWDVVVLGAGLAGISAAVSAREAGAERVLILEKTAVAGGHALLAPGTIASARPEVPNDVMRMAREIVERGGADADPALALSLSAGSIAARRRLESLGVDWIPQAHWAVGAASPRTLTPRTAMGGYEFVQLLSAEAVRRGIGTLFGMRATGLRREKSGRLTVEARPVTPEEVLTAELAPARHNDRVMHFEARAVVIATGGWGANRRMRRRYAPDISDSVATTADPQGLFGDPATGDGIRIGEDFGADLTGMQHVQLIPYAGGRTTDVAGGEIWIDDSAARFVSEGESFAVVRQAMEERGIDHFWALSDASTLKNAGIGSKLASGLVHECKTLEEAAVRAKLPIEALRRTVARWNDSVKQGRDADTGRPLLHARPIAVPPFYIGRETLLVHFTSGGLRVDARTEVLDRRGRPIDGLFAAGEVMGGIHGRDRLSGNAITAALVFGDIAGREAADCALRRR